MLFCLLALSAAVAAAPYDIPLDVPDGVVFVSPREAVPALVLDDVPRLLDGSDSVIDLVVPPPLMPATAPAAETGTVRTGEAVRAVAAEVRSRES